MIKSSTTNSTYHHSPYDYHHHHHFPATTSNVYSSYYPNHYITQTNISTKIENDDSSNSDLTPPIKTNSLIQNPIILKLPNNNNNNNNNIDVDDKTEEELKRTTTELSSILGVSSSFLQPAEEA